MNDIENLGIMLDIETLDIGPRSIITQIGMVAFDMDDQDAPRESYGIYLSLEGQLNLIPPRTISGSTLNFWIKQDPKIRDVMFESIAECDAYSLPASLNHFIRTLNEWVGERKDWTLFSRGPQFDVVNVESLLHDYSVRAPWKYNQVMDLRTIMRIANVQTSEVTSKWSGSHDAVSDCQFQIDCLFFAKSRMRRGD